MLKLFSFAVFLSLLTLSSLQARSETTKKELRLIPFGRLLQLPEDKQIAYFTALREFMHQQEQHYRSGTFSHFQFNISGFAKAIAQEPNNSSQLTSGKNKCEYSEDALNGLTQAKRNTLLNGEKCLMGGPTICLVPVNGQLRCQIADNPDYNSLLETLGCATDKKLVACVPPLYITKNFNPKDSRSFCVPSKKALSVAETCKQASISDGDYINTIRQNKEKMRQSYDGMRDIVEKYCQSGQVYNFDKADCAVLMRKLDLVTLVLEQSEKTEYVNRALCKGEVVPNPGRPDEKIFVQLYSDANGKLQLGTNASSFGWKVSACHHPKDPSKPNELKPKSAKTGWADYAISGDQPTNQVCLTRHNSQTNTTEMIGASSVFRDAYDYDS